MSTNIIKTATANYTGGGIYVYYGQLADGSYFFTDDDNSDGYVTILDADYNTIGDDEYEWFDEHEVGYREVDYCDILRFIIDNKPEGNYAIGELEWRLTESSKVLTKSDIIRKLADHFGIEPNEDGGYDLTDYDWTAGCNYGGGIWLSLAEVVNAICGE